MSKTILIVGLATLISLATYVALAPQHHHHSDSSALPDFDVALLKDVSHVVDFEVKVAAFREWIIEHSKLYSLVELPARFRAWSDNYDIVEEHNAKNLSFELGMNNLADLTREEHAALNLGFDRSMMKDHELNIEELDESLTASSIDWRDKGAVSSIKNQAQCGACWAFASAAALEGLRKIKKGGSVPNFSPQQLVDCSSSYGNQGCNGGTMVAAYQYTKAKGIELESSYSYKGSQGSCKYSSSKVSYKNGGYKSVGNSYTQLQAAVTNQPVTVAVEADQSAFQLYKSGVIKSGCGTNLDHAITAVGFTSSYWIVKNQWGTSWGNKGYVYIAKGSSNVCGINSMASYPTA